MNLIHNEATRFDSAGNYCKFVTAREFWDLQDNCSFVYTPNLAERLGHALSRLVLRPSDFLFRNIDNPIAITAVTIVAFIVVSFVFYPGVVTAIAGYVLPQFVINVFPAALRFGLFALAEMTVVGIGMRAFGRMNNPEIVAAWNARRLLPISIGTRIQIR